MCSSTTTPSPAFGPKSQSRSASILYSRYRTHCQWAPKPWRLTSSPRSTARQRFAKYVTRDWIEDLIPRQTFCQASIDNDFSLQGRFNWRWNSALVTKTSLQLQRGTDQAMLSIENDYQGSDFAANLKAINPSIIEGGLTGIFVGDYLQSITPKLALGVSAMWQRAAMNQGPETLVSYGARYKSQDWIASARVLGAGSLQASYWRRIAEKVEAGVDLSLQVAPAMAGPGMMGVGSSKEGVATLGAKYEFRHSTFRAQGDSKGRLACLLEKRVAPAVQVTFAGEIDHAKVRDSHLNNDHTTLTDPRTKPKSASKCKSKTHPMNSWSSKKGQPICRIHHSRCYAHTPLISTTTISTGAFWTLSCGIRSSVLPPFSSPT